VSGANFGSQSASVTIAETGYTTLQSPTSCTPTGHTVLECTGMEGSGTAVAVTVTRPDSETATKTGSFDFIGEFEVIRIHR
jgi:hypothetical protein